MYEEKFTESMQSSLNVQWNASIHSLIININTFPFKGIFQTIKGTVALKGLFLGYLTNYWYLTHKWKNYSFYLCQKSKFHMHILYEQNPWYKLKKVQSVTQ